MSDVEFAKAHDAGCELLGRGAGVPDSLRDLADHISRATDDQPSDGLIAALGRVLIRHRETSGIAPAAPAWDGRSSTLRNELHTGRNAPAAPRPALATDMLAGLAPDLRAWLVDEMGMEPELTGGGAVQLRHSEQSGAYVLVTGEGGSGLPLADDWCVGAYPEWADMAENAFLVSYSGPHSTGMTLRQAVMAACSIVVNYEPSEAPASPLELGTALVRDALQLLDVVTDIDDRAMDDGHLRVTTDDGRVLRVTIGIVEPVK